MCYILTEYVFHYRVAVISKESVNPNLRNCFGVMERRIQGAAVVFLLDTTSAMRGEGLEQMKRAFLSIITGYSDQSTIDHCVAVISFGREIKILQNYSNDYSRILQSLDGISCEGSSSLNIALEAAIPFLKSRLSGSFIGPFFIRANLVIMSGGDVTGDANEDERDKKINLLHRVENIGKENPIVCIPVGTNPDMCFLGSIAFSSRCGKLIDVGNASQYARYFTNMVVASEIIGSVPTVDFSLNEIREAVQCKFHTTTEKDIGDVYDILKNRHAYEYDSSLRPSFMGNHFNSEGDLMLPPIGTRVRRGHNWPFTNQDSNKPGTVVGYRNDHYLVVEWDTGMRFDYYFDKTGDHQNSNVVVCDEPRTLQREKIAVGCLVERGPDWKWFDQDGGKGNIGSVYGVEHENTVLVRWPNGTKSNYRFGYDGKYDVLICNPLDKTTIRRIEKQQNCSYLNDSEKDEVNDGISGEQMNTTSSVDYSSSWEWKNKEGKWVSFPKSAIEKIQHACDRNRNGTVLVRIKEDLYRVVPSKMIQINMESRETFEIRHHKLPE